MVQRKTILALLSDEETSKVSASEGALRLSEGEEFVNLEQLEQGVLRADGVSLDMGRVLARKAVQERTWQRIVELLGSPAVG